MEKQTNNLDIPIDDIDCWTRYPKYRWVYELTRLLDSQNVKWLPYENKEMQNKMPNIELHTVNHTSILQSYIYTEDFSTNRYIAEAYILKGEIKLLRYFNKTDMSLIEDQTGNLSLRVNAFVSMHFKKYTGVISVEFANNTITSIKLRSRSELGISTNDIIIKLIRRIYKK